MPPPKTKKLTAQPIRTRHFPGKPAATEAEERSSSDESESEEERQQPKPYAKPRPAPVASSFPKAALKSKLAARQKEAAERKALEAEFETEDEEEEDGKQGTGSESGSGSGSESEDESSEEEESSSEEEAPKKLLRPVFVKKKDRNQGAVKSADELAAEDERRRQEQARAIVQEQVEQRAAERAAGKKDWDDDVEDADIDAIDDTDRHDPAEYLAWKLRELKRIKRERLAIEEAEAERAEIDRRRNLSAADREAEDRAFIEQQQQERGDRGQMQYMQKYFHKGAFFSEELAELGVDRRNLMNARFEDQTNREVLPEFMQIRDMTKLGKKGRTRYKDMRSEDTGKWGDLGYQGPRRDASEYGLDDRFRPDSYGGRDGGRGEGATGANAKPLGDRKRFGEDKERDSKRPRFDD